MRQLFVLKNPVNVRNRPAQPAITCSKLTTETLKQGVKYAKGNNKDIITTPKASF